VVFALIVMSIPTLPVGKCVRVLSKGSFDPPTARLPKSSVVGVVSPPTRVLSSTPVDTPVPTALSSSVAFAVDSQFSVGKRVFAVVGSA